ncbi:hypothetical protein CBR_g57036 [Chara braunii]|uniref:Uncharacterized protein n=1 Tax=Chara braunii TaxID=69332 RepID=A0A388K7W5_CHABU|nr:hypothetical protein CBR_g57036 [Chara braunii]|eukprot:GBG66154.1 hypothetical protein CBR_g57036 [Chara braunii]
MSVKTVCESALGRKVDIPEDDDNEVAKLRKELEELHAKSHGESSESRLEALWKEKEALLKRNQESEEEKLNMEIAELKSRKEQGRSTCEGQDAIIALQLQIKELGAFRTAPEERNAEASALKSENRHLKKYISELRKEFVNIKGKRIAEAVTKSSPPEEPAKGKQRADPSTMAVYMLRILRLFRRQDHGKKNNTTQPENKLLGSGGARSIVDVAHDLEVAKMAGFREARLKDLQQAKKADMETACAEEGISYIKLEQAKADVAEIRASRDYAEWLKEKEKGQDDHQDQHYATTTEEVGEERGDSLSVSYLWELTLLCRDFYVDLHSDQFYDVLNSRLVVILLIFQGGIRWCG